MTAGRIGRGWVETGLVGLARPDRFGQFVVDRENHVLRAVGTKGCDVFLFDDWKTFHDVGDGIAGGGEISFERGRGVAGPLVRSAQIEMKEGGVDFSTQQAAAVFIPAKRRACIATVNAEGF